MTQSASGTVQESPAAALDAAIAGQPDAVSDIITSNFDSIRAAAALVAGARRVRLCGVGMGAEAAVVGEYLLRSVGVDARAANAFDLASYPSSLDPGELVVVLQQRDGRAYPGRVMQRAVHAGHRTIAIVTGGMTTTGVDVTIETAAQDDDLPAAVALPAMLALLAAIAARFEPRAPLAAALPGLREITRSVIGSRETARDVAAALSATGGRLLLVGGGAGVAVARAGALALRETAGLAAGALHLEDALHGALVPCSAGDVLVQIAPEGATGDRQADIATVADALGVDRWKIGGNPNGADGARWHTPLPSVPEVLATIPAFLPLQWLALELALISDPLTLRRLDPRVAAAHAAIAL
jgi:glucosamine 6-phosphate synthetase-like amidotransferase/phosphosugar isomerase protein